MNNVLDVLMQDLRIIDPETGKIPDSEEECCVIKIQLLAAQVIADDIQKIKKVSPTLSDDEILNKLLCNWMENIRDFTTAVISSNEKKCCGFCNVD
ncbi:MAG: hypothetical protein LBB21_05150 [Holosporaceae bacterium]|jgi:hypothetical protein|nr:hypothetical protein [Holosporaceae bacterium]